MPTSTQSSILENSIREAQEAYNKIPRKFQTIIDNQAATIPGKEHIFYATPNASFLYNQGVIPDYKHSNVICIFETPMGSSLNKLLAQEMGRVYQPDDLQQQRQSQVVTRGGGENLSALVWTAASLPYSQQATGNTHMVALGITNTAGTKVLSTVEVGVLTFGGKVTSINNVSVQDVRNFFSTHGGDQWAAKVACERLSIHLPTQTQPGWMLQVAPGEKHPETKRVSTLYQVIWAPSTSNLGGFDIKGPSRGGGGGLGFSGELSSYGYTASKPFHQLQSEVRSKVEIGWGAASSVSSQERALAAKATITKTFADIEPLIDRIGRIPGGVVIDAQTQSLPRISSVELGSEEGSFVINSQWLYRSGLSAEECSILYHSVCIDQEAASRLGASSLATVFGTEPDNAVGIFLRLIDARLGELVFGMSDSSEDFTRSFHPEYRNPVQSEIQAVRALDREAILSKAKALSIPDTQYIFIRTTAVDFALHSKHIEIDGLSAELPPVCASGDSSCPDFRSAGGADRFKELNPFSYAVVEHLQKNLSSYIQNEPTFMHLARYSALASLLRKAKADNAKFSDQTLIQEIYTNRLKQQYPVNADPRLKLSDSFLYGQACQDLLKECEKGGLPTDVLTSMVHIGHTWAMHCNDLKTTTAFRTQARIIFARPVDPRVPKSVIQSLAASQHNVSYRPARRSWRLGNQQDGTVRPTTDRARFSSVASQVRDSFRERGSRFTIAELDELLGRALKTGSCREVAYYAAVKLYHTFSAPGAEANRFRDILAPFNHPSLKAHILEGLAEALIDGQTDRASEALNLWHQLCVEFFNNCPSQTVFLYLVRNLNHGTQFEKRTQSGFVNSMCQAMDGKVKSSDGRPLLLKESFTEDTHAYVGQVIREARGQ